MRTTTRDYAILIRTDPVMGKACSTCTPLGVKNQIKKIVLHKRISALTSTGEKPGDHEKLMKLPKAR